MGYKDQAQQLVVTDILQKQVLMTPDSTPREILPPQGLFRIQGWNRYKDPGTIATMGWMQ
jgi:hypothetical protein